MKSKSKECRDTRIQEFLERHAHEEIISISGADEVEEGSVAACEGETLVVREYPYKGSARNS